MSALRERLWVENNLRLVFTHRLIGQKPTPKVRSSLAKENRRKGRPHLYVLWGVVRRVGSPYAACLRRSYRYKKAISRQAVRLKQWANYVRSWWERLSQPQRFGAFKTEGIYNGKQTAFNPAFEESPEKILQREMVLAHALSKRKVRTPPEVVFLVWFGLFGLLFVFLSM